MIRESTILYLNANSNADLIAQTSTLLSWRRVLLIPDNFHHSSLSSPFTVSISCVLCSLVCLCRSCYSCVAGINNPLTKIYITSEPLEHFPLVLFFFVLQYASKLGYNARTSTLENKDKSLPLDGAPLVVGVITLLKQFHSLHTHTFLAYLGQYVRAHVSASPAGAAGGGVAPTAAGAAGKVALTPEVTSVLLFLEDYCRFSHTSRHAVDAFIPSYIFDRFAHGGEKA
jgi:WASH complex subunit strumpellin